MARRLSWLWLVVVLLVAAGGTWFLLHRGSHARADGGETPPAEREGSIVALATPERPAEGATLTWLGQACFRVGDADGHSVIIDPYDAATIGQNLKGLTGDVAWASTNTATTTAWTW